MLISWHPGLLEVRAGDFGGSGMGWSEGAFRGEDSDTEWKAEHSKRRGHRRVCYNSPELGVDSAPTTAGVI